MPLPGVHQVKFKSVTTATANGTELVAAVASKRTTVINYALVSSAALSVKFQSASTDLTGAMAVAANGGVAAVGSPMSPLFQTAVGEALNIHLSAATQVSGHIAYIVED